MHSISYEQAYPHTNRLRLHSPGLKTQAIEQDFEAVHWKYVSRERPFQ